MTDDLTTPHTPYSEMLSPFIMDDATFRRLGYQLVDRAITSLEE
jgi:hypothetical protein